MATVVADVVLRHFFPHRGWAARAPAPPAAEQLERAGWARLEARTPEGGEVVLLVLDGEAAARLPALRKALESVAAPPAVFYVAAGEPFFKRPQLADAAREHGATVCSWDVFCCDLPRHAESAPHRVLAEEEVAALARIHVLPGHLPYVRAADPQVVWAGGAPGQVVEVRQRSATAGEAVTYRLVV